MPENDSSVWWAGLRSMLTRVDYVTGPWRPWTPAVAIALAFLARHTDSMFLRGLSSIAAFILFLLVSVDAARTLWEADRGPWSPLRHSIKAPFRFFRVFLALALTLVYTFSIIFLLASFFILPSLWVFLVISPFVLVAAGLVAWHNVRLWSFQSVEYEQLLKDEQQVYAESERMKEMRTRGSELEGPSQ